MNTQSEPPDKVIAFCGTRGVPANYGGFETTVDEISRRFAQRGYDCVVFCRASASDLRLESHEGRRLVYVKGSSVGTLDTFVSAFQTGLHLLRNREGYDYVFWFNNANLPGILLTLLTRIPLSVNTDGLEWRRPKWRWPFKVYSFVSSFLVSCLCKSLISDSRAIQSYYKKTFLKETQFIPYGTPRAQTVPLERKSTILDRYGVESGRYFLQITRFEPDNLPLTTAKSFQAAGLARKGFKLLLVGYQRDTAYARQVKAISGRDGILVLDAIYDAEVLAVLRANCFCYVHGNFVGGTNPALLEAMASSPRILAIEGPFSREVLGETGYFFTVDNMAVSFRSILNCPDRSAAMRSRVQSNYQWDSVAESYMRLAEGRPAAYAPLASKLN